MPEEGEARFARNEVEALDRLKQRGRYRYRKDVLRALTVVVLRRRITPTPEAKQLLEASGPRTIPLRLGLTPGTIQRLDGLSPGAYAQPLHEGIRQEGVGSLSLDAARNPPPPHRGPGRPPPDLERLRAPGSWNAFAQSSDGHE